RTEITLANAQKKPMVMIVREQVSDPPELQSILVKMKRVHVIGSTPSEAALRQAQFFSVLKTALSPEPYQTQSDEASSSQVRPPKRQLGQITPKPTQSGIDPIALSGLLIVNLVSPLNLQQEDQDFIEQELQWLFNAIDMLLSHHHQLKKTGTLDYSQTVSSPIPNRAQLLTPNANNRLLPTPLKMHGLSTTEEVLDYLWHRKIKRRLADIDKKLSQLSTLFKRATAQGQAAKENDVLNETIRDEQLELINLSKKLSNIASEAFGIQITAPNHLQNWLEKQINEVSPTALGGLIIANVISRFGLSQEDQDFVNSELKWLFSATENLLAITQILQTQGLLDNGLAIAEAIPTEAEIRVSGANNHLLTQPDKVKSGIFDDVGDVLSKIWKPAVVNQLQVLNTTLIQLGHLREREAELGASAQTDFSLQETINSHQTQVAETLKKMATTISEAYGIYVTTPEQLVALLQEA
ncbi:MAG: hypothetical protein AAF485_09760, partial [Chloroflexota bacterium]